MGSGSKRWRACWLAGTLAWHGGGALAGSPDGPASATSTSGGASPTEIAHVTAVWDAMSVADITALTRLYKDRSDPVAHAWAAMALERVHFRLDAASDDARVCEDVLFTDQPVVALRCGQFRVGDLQLAGRWTEAGLAEDALIERYRGHVPDSELTLMQTHARRRATQPATSYELPQGDVILPLQDSASPSFEATGNGRTFDLTLDTGASDILLGAREAARLHVKPLGEDGHSGGWLSKTTRAQTGQLDTLSFGGITLHHVPVTIVPQSIALIGVNLMAPLGTLRISRRSIQIYAPHSPVPACDAPMLISSGVGGEGLRLRPQLLVNDVPQAVMLDTGAYPYLVGTRAALDEVTVLHWGKTAIVDAGGVHPFARTDAARVKLTIAGQPYSILFALYPDSTNKLVPALTLGAAALQDMDFLLDFRHQHQCFLLHPDQRRRNT